MSLMCNEGEVEPEAADPKVDFLEEAAAEAEAAIDAAVGKLWSFDLLLYIFGRCDCDEDKLESLKNEKEKN